MLVMLAFSWCSLDDEPFPRPLTASVSVHRKLLCSSDWSRLLVPLSVNWLSVRTNDESALKKKKKDKACTVCMLFTLVFVEKLQEHNII